MDKVLKLIPEWSRSVEDWELLVGPLVDKMFAEPSNPIMVKFLSYISDYLGAMADIVFRQILFHTESQTETDENHMSELDISRPGNDTKLQHSLFFIRLLPLKVFNDQKSSLVYDDLPGQNNNIHDISDRICIAALLLKRTFNKLEFEDVRKLSAELCGRLHPNDYVATRWYMAPELCGSFFSKYTPAIDTWSIGCIFAELLTGKPLFPGKNVVHQLDLMTDLLGTPSPEAIARIRNEKARRYLSSMRKKKPIPFSQKFPNADPRALRLLERMLAFEPKDRPNAEEALSDPYFKNLAKVEREPSAQPVTKMEFEFERRKITKDDVRELIYREILEYHPNMLKEFLDGAEPTGFMYPSAVDQFKKQFAHLEEHYGKGTAAAPLERQQSSSLPRACVLYPKETAQRTSEVTNGLSKCSIKDVGKQYMTNPVPMTRLPQSIQGGNARPGKVVGSVTRYNNNNNNDALEQQRIGRNTPVAAPTHTHTQFPLPASSYPRRSSNSSSCKNDTVETTVEVSGNGLQARPPYFPRKVAAAQSGPGSQWY